MAVVEWLEPMVVVQAIVSVASLDSNNLQKHNKDLTPSFMATPSLGCRLLASIAKHGCFMSNACKHCMIGMCHLSQCGSGSLCTCFSLDLF